LKEEKFWYTFTILPRAI